MIKSAPFPPVFALDCERECMTDRFRALDLNLLRVFEALMQEGHVTRAAQRLCLTQPAVSNALARLREHFDDVLFEKTRGGVVPTAVARALWQTLEPHYRGLHDVLSPPAFDPAGHQGRVRIAMTDYTSERVLPRLGAHLQRHAPGLRLEIVPYSLADQPVLFEKEGVELALGTYLDGYHQSGVFRTQALWTIAFGLLLRAGHPLEPNETGGTVDLQAFLQAPHVEVCSRGMHTGVYDQILAAHGLQRNLAFTLHGFQQALMLIQASDCVAVLPRSLIAQGPYADSLRALEPPIPAPPRDLRLIWHRRHEGDPAHGWLRQTIVGMFSGAGMAQDG